MDGQALPLSELRRAAARETLAARSEAAPVERSDADAEAVSRVLDGDSAAFALLVRRHKRGIYVLCLRYLRSEEDAADLSQRVFLRAYEKLGTFRRQASCRTWIYRIAVNLCLNAIRDRARRPTVPLEVHDAAVPASQEGHAELTRQRQLLRDAVDQLPPKQRSCVILRVYHDLAFAEVAEILQSSVGSVKVNYHHAMKRLKSLIPSDEEAR